MPKQGDESNEIALDAMLGKQERERSLSILRAEVHRGIDQLNCGEYVELSDNSDIDAFFDEVLDRSKRRQPG